MATLGIETLYQFLNDFRSNLSQAFLKVAKITKFWMTRKEKQRMLRQADNGNVTKLDTPGGSVQIGKDLDGTGLPKMLAPRFLNIRLKVSIVVPIPVDGFKVIIHQLLEKQKQQKYAFTRKIVVYVGGLQP